MNIAGKSLELFFIDGRPDGMLTAEVFNWTGHVLRFNRTQLREGLSRKETGYTGVYILLGQSDGKSLAYVGEAEDMRERIKDHATKKEWWDSVVMITTSANNLHKAHVKYLESRLVEIGRGISPDAFENANQPPRSSLSEAAVSNMESFLDTLLMVLPAIRIDTFLDKKRTPELEPTKTAAPETHFEFALPRNGITAQAILKNGELIVLKGSRARLTWVGVEISYTSLHNELVAKGIILAQGDVGVFTEDYAFSSPSAAAAVVAGRSANGRISWKIAASGLTYGDWEEQQLQVPIP